MNKKILSALLFAVSIVSLAFTEELSGKEIMQKAADREVASSSSFKMKMTLISSSGKERVREVSAYSKDDGKEKKSVMIFLLPADIKGTGYLSYSYKNSTKEDDRWLYIPALKKARRITGSSGGDNFMGTDFTYDDISGYKVEDFTHKFLGEENIDGRKCWKVESTPNKKSDYSKYISWVDQESLLQLKAEFYNKKNILVKVLTVSDIEKKDGFWTALKIEMNNIEKEHKTIVENLDMEFNKNIPDSYFRVSSLESGRIK